MKSTHPILAFILVVAAFFFILGIYPQTPANKSGEISEQEPVRELITRTPQVAGGFYPADPVALKQQISSFLEKAEKKDAEGLAILIAPHAGYIYSGQVAAYSYKQLEGKKFDTVVVIGPSHRANFDGISVFDGDFYETPLGKVEIDREIVGQLKSSSKKIFYYPTAEVGEHSVEVQVPFLQSVLGDFKFVPMIMGVQSLENAQILSDALWKVADDNTLIVISTDLSHYHPYQTAVAMDNLTLGIVEKLDANGLVDAIRSGNCEACGYGPVVAAILTAKKLGKDKAEVLKYANSGDVTGDNSRVVGYGAVMIYGAQRFSGEERSDLLKIARTSIEAYVRYQKVPSFEVSDPKLKNNSATFVTITENGRLRGCIGTTMPVQPLYLAVRDAAISAAVRDPRFMPLSVAELNKIHLEISVLSPLKEISPDSVVVGKHGLVISKSGQSGLLLPQVATDYGWDRETFLDQTCEKAGLPQGCWREGAHIYAFEAEVFGE